MTAFARRLLLSLACAALSTVAPSCGSSGESSGGGESDGGETEGATGSSSGGSSSAGNGGSGTGDAAMSSGGGPSSDAGTPDAATADGTDGASSPDAPAAVTQTVSSWLGTNVAADLPRVDVAYQLAPFDTPAAQLDANGYPVAGASGESSTDIGFVLPSGTYKISYVGTGTLNVSGIGKLGGAWQSAGGEQRNTVVITRAATSGPSRRVRRPRTTRTRGLPSSRRSPQGGS